MINMLTTEKLNVFFLGKAFSGSTILGSFLNKHPKICYIGELDRLPGNTDYNPLHYGPEVCIRCALKQSSCRLFSKTTVSKISNGNPIQAIEFIRRKVNKPIIVDGSKNVDWLRIALSNQNPEVVNSSKVIILVKNPASFLYSCNDRGTGQLWEEANAWRDLYVDAIRTTNQLGVAALLVRVEDFESNKELVLKRVCSFLNVPFTNNMFSPDNDMHSIGGNGRAALTSLDKKSQKKILSEIELRDFGINPKKVKKNKIIQVKKSIDINLLETVFMTPGLLDIASQLGYKFSDF